MKVKISEVWNAEGRSEELAMIECAGSYSGAVAGVGQWIRLNRPDLFMADSLSAHGYHAVAFNGDEQDAEVAA